MGSVQSHTPRSTPAIVAVLFFLAAGAAIGENEAPRPTTPSDSLRALTEALFTAGRYDSVLTILPAFIRRAEATGDSVLLGRAITQRGRARLTLGRPADAEADIDAGIHIAESVRDTVGLMTAVHFKAYVYTARGQYDDAMRSFERRLFLAQRTHSPVDEAWARSGMGYELHLLDQQERAKEEYTRAIELFRASGSTRLESTPLLGLGRVENALGNQDNAVRCYQRAWVAAQDAGDRLNEMWAVNNLGSMEYERGDLSRAEQYQQRAFDLARELKSSWAIVVPATNLAEGAMELGDFETAEAFLIEARTLCETQQNAVYLGLLDLRLAELRMGQGRHEAAAELLRGLTADLESLEPQHRDEAMMDLAQVLASSDSVEAAIALLSKYTEQSGRRLYARDAANVYLLLARLHNDANHNSKALAYALRARETGRAQRDRRIMVASMLLESQCYRTSGRVDDAATTFYAALDSMEAIRGGITTPDWRETYGQEVSQDIVEAGRVLLEVPTSASQSTRDEAFFDAVQRIKTRTLLDRITEPRFGNAGIEGRWSPGVATLRDVQAILRPEEVMVDLCVGTRRSFVTLVTADSMRVVELAGPSSALADRVRLFRRIIANGDAASRAQYTGERMTAMQRSVGDDVLGNVADVVLRSRRLFVSADGFFATVPFGILILHDHEDVLMRDRDVVQIPSASVLVIERQTKQSASDDGASVVAIAPSNERLTGARDEVRDLARRYDNVQVVAGVDGARGFEAAAGGCDVLHIAAHALVVDQSPWQSGFRVADIPATATDAIVPDRHQSAAPSFLSPADSLRVARAFRSDPYIRAWQIARLRLAARLTVLSGCETAGGRVTTGEGTLGLTAAFLSAGVPVVVSSLWPVDDRVTRLMMRSFYRHLAAGDPVATALRRSQLEISRSSEYSHPYFWAGFTAVGEGSMGISIERRRLPLPDGALVAAIGAVILVTFLFAVRRRRPSE